eukprot:6000639-Pleurochrysis_carterae.AAC.2
MRSRSASLRDNSLLNSFLSTVKDLRRSLAGGLPSVCITWSWSAYDWRWTRTELRVRSRGWKLTRFCSANRV